MLQFIETSLGSSVLCILSIIMLIGVMLYAFVVSSFPVHFGFHPNSPAIESAPYYGAILVVLILAVLCLWYYSRPSKGDDEEPKDGS